MDFAYTPDDNDKKMCKMSRVILNEFQSSYYKSPQEICFHTCEFHRVKSDDLSMKNSCIFPFHKFQLNLIDRYVDFRRNCHKRDGNNNLGKIIVRKCSDDI